jgi:peroxiredoxin
MTVENRKFEDYVLFGSYTDKQNDTLKQQLKIIEKRYQDANQKYAASITEYRKATDSLTKLKLYENILEQQGTIRKENDDKNRETVLFISTHNKSYVSSAYLYSFLTNLAIATDSTEILYANLTSPIKNSEFGKLIKEELDKRRINIVAPDFTAKDIKGNAISLKSFSNKYVLLNFWASYCIPCIEEIPDLQKIATDYEPRGFEILNISVDNSKSNCIKAINEYGLQRFYNIFANDNDTIRKIYSNTSQPIPSQILINKQGIIIWNSINPQTEQNSMQSIAVLLRKEFE